MAAQAEAARAGATPEAIAAATGAAGIDGPPDTSQSFLRWICVTARNFLNIDSKPSGFFTGGFFFGRYWRRYLPVAQIFLNMNFA